MRVLAVTIAGLMLLAFCGCESATPPGAAQRFDSAPPPPTPETPPEAAPAAEGEAAPAEAPAADAAAPAAAEPAAAPAEPPAEPAEPAAEPAAPAPSEPPATETAEKAADTPPAEGEALSEAKAGVGKKGKDYGGPGFVTTPVETMFRIEERIDFEAQIPKAMQLYKANHNNKGPKTHEEFMSVIIKEHGVKLPILPEGSTYWYDAKTEKLMVRTPKTE